MITGSTCVVFAGISPKSSDSKLDIDAGKSRIPSTNLIKNIDRVGSGIRNHSTHTAGVIHQEHHIGFA
tara:strand:- start:12 stop:215 length:204 start_codon:yes stop_codon:yes gene_type:complete